MTDPNAEELARVADAPAPEDPEGPFGAQTVTEEDVAAMERATAILTRTLADPLKVAQENAELRSTIKGAYALLHVMTRRLGGSVLISFDEHSNIPPTDGDLEIARLADGGVSIRLHKPNRAERRAAKK